nr:unnamed protein product [Callosobruchus analis]CAI5854146.1 unnamed protein product [Callosobruchus analis]
MTSGSGADLSNSELLSKLVQLIKKESEDIKTEIRQEIQEIRKENTRILGLIKQQDDKIEYLEQKNLQLERAVRKNNVLVFGLDVDAKTTNLVNVVIQKLNNLLETNLSVEDVNNIYVIKSEKNCPVKIELVSYLKKQQVFHNIHKLKKSGVFIVHDLCPKDQEINKILQKHRKAAKAKNYTAKIIGNKLIINGDTYSVDELENEDYVMGSNNPSAPDTPTANITGTPFQRSSVSPSSKPQTKKAKIELVKETTTDQVFRKTRLQSQSRYKL